jgi:DNA repair protein RecO (recombination protein O)
LGTIQQIADSLDNLVHEEEDKDIWNLLNEALGRLNDYQLIYHYFLWNLFSILGYQINLYHCVVCQKRLSPSKLYFSPDQGGILCSDCSDRAEEKEEVSPNVIKTLRLLLKKDWDTLSRLKIPDSEKEQLELISELNLRSLAP